MVRALFFLPSISGYPDRVSLLKEVSTGLDSLALLVGQKDADVDTAGYDRFSVVDARFRRGWLPWNMWRASRLAEEMVRQAGVDVVHDTFGALLPLFWRKRRYPSVRFVTSLYILKSWRRRHVWGHLGALRILSSRHTALFFLTLWMERRICAAADYVVLQAHGLTDHLLEDGRVPSSKVRILTNSVDTGFWSPGNGRPPPNGHQRECRLLFVGGIDVSKGMVAMIETLHLLKEWGHPARLTIVGKWGHAAKSAAFRLLDRYGVGNKIDFLPKTSKEELREIYRDADLFLYQTINDGSPRVVLEALACGLPVIASRHPGIDVIDPGEDFIAFTDFGDANQMARFVRDFSERPDLWQHRAKAGRQAVDDRFNIPTVARQYVEYYQQLTENAPAEPASAT